MNTLCKLGIHICHRTYPTRYFGLKQGDLVIAPYKCSCGRTFEKKYVDEIPYNTIIKFSTKEKNNEHQI